MITQQDFVKSFYDFISLEESEFIFEGGAAIKTSRTINQKEGKDTLINIQEKLFPILDLKGIGKDCSFIGSLGKKKDEKDESGDIDLAIDAKSFSSNHNVPENDLLNYLYQTLTNELPQVLGFEPELNLMRGLKVLSIGWPIAGDKNNGIVQLDLIPVVNLKWTDFIYYSPDYRVDESKYKSAHRNWLFSAILDSRKRVLEKNDNGEDMLIEKKVLRLPDGLYEVKKSFEGITKRLKRAKTVPGTEKFITSDPQEFLDIVLGTGYNPDQVKTFESLWNIVKSPNFKYHDSLETIKKKYTEDLKNAGLKIPNEL
jgi:hypothetical protein